MEKPEAYMILVQRLDRKMFYRLSLTRQQLNQFWDWYQQIKKEANKQ